MDFFDAVIELRPMAVPRCNEQLVKFGEDDDGAFEADGTPLMNLRELKRRTFPVMNFNPSAEYVAELEAHFGDVALFFADVYGGTDVGIVWKNVKADAELVKVGKPWIDEPFKIVEVRTMII
jgi:hypothetical protein